MSLATGLTAIILISCNVIRMSQVAVTYDEATTYIKYLSGSYQDIIANTFPTANNHFLNSLMAKFFIDTIGDSLFVMRLPGLVAQIVYLIFSYALAKKLLDRPLWIFTFFLLLQLNPFLFDFMGLCRGYALAIALLMASVYYLIVYLQKNRAGWLALSVFFMTAAVYANLSILNYTIAFFVIIAWQHLHRYNNAAAIRAAAISASSAIIIYLLTGKQIAAMRAAEQLYFGGHSNFIRDTAGTLLQDSLYLDTSNNIVYTASVILVLLALTTGAYWISALYKGRDKAFYGLSLWLLLIIPALSTILQHHILNTPYLITRTALFFYPLFIISQVYTLYHISRDKLWGKQFLPLIFAALFAFNFIYNLNFTHTHTWRFDRHTPWVLERIVNAKKNHEPIKLRLDWWIAGSFFYSVEKYYPGQFAPLDDFQETRYELTDYDYYLVQTKNAHEVPDNYTPDTIISDNRYLLFKKKD